MTDDAKKSDDEAAAKKARETAARAKMRDAARHRWDHDALIQSMIDNLNRCAGSDQGESQHSREPFDSTSVPTERETPTERERRVAVNLATKAEDGQGISDEENVDPGNDP